MHLSLSCHTLPGWWWAGILKGVWPRSMPFGRGICLIWGIFTAHSHICVVLIWQKRLPLQSALPYYAPPSTNPGRVGHNSDSCINISNDDRDLPPLGDHLAWSGGLGLTIPWTWCSLLRTRKHFDYVTSLNCHTWHGFYWEGSCFQTNFKDSRLHGSMQW